MIRGIIFDKDGTLFDFRATWEVWTHRVLEHLSEGIPERMVELGAAIGYDSQRRVFDKSSVVIAGTAGEIAARLAPLLGDNTPVEALLNAEAAEAPQVEVVPLAPFLQGLRARDLALGVATNDAIDPAAAHLSATGVLELFDFVAGYDSGHGGKPGPGQLLAFCEEMDLSPPECIMVGDSLTDLIAAKNAGMRAVAVRTGMAEAVDLAPYAVAVLPDIGHLPDWLDAQRS